MIFTFTTKQLTFSFSGPPQEDPEKIFVRSARECAPPPISISVILTLGEIWEKWTELNRIEQTGSYFAVLHTLLLVQFTSDTGMRRGLPQIAVTSERELCRWSCWAARTLSDRDRRRTSRVDGGAHWRTATTRRRTTLALRWRGRRQQPSRTRTPSQCWLTTAHSQSSTTGWARQHHQQSINITYYPSLQWSSYSNRSTCMRASVIWPSRSHVEMRL